MLGRPLMEREADRATVRGALGGGGASRTEGRGMTVIFAMTVGRRRCGCAPLCWLASRDVWVDRPSWVGVGGGGGDGGGAGHVRQTDRPHSERETTEKQRGERSRSGKWFTLPDRPSHVG